MDSILIRRAANYTSVILSVFQDRVLGGFFWNVFSVGMLQGSALVALFLVSRTLTIRDFGIFVVIVATVLTLAGIAQGGTGLTATKFVGEYRNNNLEKVARILRLCRNMNLAVALIFAAALHVLAPMIARVILQKPQLEPYFVWAAIATVFQTVAIYQYGAMQGFGAFRTIGIASIFVGLFHIGLTFAGAIFGGVEGACAGYAAAMALRCYFFMIALRRVSGDHNVPRATKVEPEDWAMVWHFALPACLASYVTLPCIWGATALITRQTDGLALAALFAVIQQIRATALQVPMMLNSVSFAVLSQLRGAGDRHGFNSVFLANLGVSLASSLLIAGTIALSGKLILNFFGQQFVIGYQALGILMMSVVIEMASLSIYQLVQSSGRMWVSLWFIVTPRDVGYLALSFLWLPRGGIIGIASAYLVAQCVGFVATLLTSRATHSPPALHEKPRIPWAGIDSVVD